jgi:hypothetical protein
MIQAGTQHQSRTPSSSVRCLWREPYMFYVPASETARVRWCTRKHGILSRCLECIEHINNTIYDAQCADHTFHCCSIAARRDGVEPPSPFARSGSVPQPHLHFHFEHHEASPGRPRQTKPTHSPLTRSNRRHGQYVESCCALELDGVLIIPQSQRTRLSTTRARRLTRTGTKSSNHDRARRPNHRRTDKQYSGEEDMRNVMRELETNANAYTVSTSPRPTDTLRSRVLTPSSVATTSTLSTVP